MEEEIGKISHYYNHLEVGIIELTAPLKVGDMIHIKGAHDDFTQTVDSLQIEHDQVQEAKAGDAENLPLIFSCQYKQHHQYLKSSNLPLNLQQTQA